MNVNFTGWLKNPDFVVTKITPLPPLDPYRAAVEASLRISILEISEGGKAFKSLRDCGTPSITTNGAFPLFDDMPLIITVAPAPGLGFVIMFTPEAEPWSASSILVGCNLLMDSALTELTAPETFFEFCTPYPKTTISSNALASETSDTRITFWLTTSTSFDLYPKYETTIIEFIPTFGSTKFPSKSVLVPTSVPFTTTVAPGSGEPVSESKTIPVICCEKAIPENKIVNNK